MRRKILLQAPFFETPCFHSIIICIYLTPVPRRMRHWFNFYAEYSMFEIKSFLFPRSVVLWGLKRPAYPTTRIGWKVHGLTKILSWNVTKRGLSFHIILQVVHTLLPSTLQCLDPIDQRSYQQQIWRHHLNFSAY